MVAPEQVLPVFAVLCVAYAKLFPEPDSEAARVSPLERLLTGLAQLYDILVYLVISVASLAKDIVRVEDAANHANDRVTTLSDQFTELKVTLDDDTKKFNGFLEGLKTVLEKQVMTQSSHEKELFKHRKDMAENVSRVDAELASLKEELSKLRSGLARSDPPAVLEERKAPIVAVVVADKEKVEKKDAMVVESATLPSSMVQPKVKVTVPVCSKMPMLESRLQPPQKTALTMQSKLKPPLTLKSKLQPPQKFVVQTETQPKAPEKIPEPAKTGVTKIKPLPMKSGIPPPKKSLLRPPSAITMPKTKDVKSSGLVPPKKQTRVDRNARTKKENRPVVVPTIMITEPDISEVYSATEMFEPGVTSTPVQKGEWKMFATSIPDESFLQVPAVGFTGRCDEEDDYDEEEEEEEQEEEEEPVPQRKPLRPKNGRGSRRGNADSMTTDGLPDSWSLESAIAGMPDEFFVHLSAGPDTSLSSLDDESFVVPEFVRDGRPAGKAGSSPSVVARGVRSMTGSVSEARETTRMARPSVPGITPSDSLENLEMAMQKFESEMLTLVTPGSLTPVGLGL